MAPSLILALKPTSPFQTTPIYPMLLLLACKQHLLADQIHPHLLKTNQLQSGKILQQEIQGITWEDTPGVPPTLQLVVSEEIQAVLLPGMIEVATLEAQEAIQLVLEAILVLLVDVTLVVVLTVADLLPGVKEPIPINPIAMNALLLFFWANLHTAGQIIRIACEFYFIFLLFYLKPKSHLLFIKELLVWNVRKCLPRKKEGSRT